MRSTKVRRMPDTRPAPSSIQGFPTKTAFLAGSLALVFAACSSSSSSNSGSGGSAKGGSGRWLGR